MSSDVGPSIMPSTSPVPVTQLRNATTSATAAGDSLLYTAPRVLLSFPLRALYRAETFAFRTVPQNIARLVGFRGAVSAAGSTGFTRHGVAAATHAGADSAVEGLADTMAHEGSSHLSDILYTMRKLGGFFSYLTSGWSLACLALSLVLNRITIYASTRRHLRLGWERRLALRIIPIVLFVSQILTLLRAIRCQTSPDYSAMRYGSPGKKLIFDYAGGGGALYSLSSKLLAWESDQQSCSAVKMGRPVNASDIPYGSFSLLWPVYMVLCLGHFVHTLSCSLEGRAVMTEAGMSIFEHSLAFSEAESMISKSIGLGLLGLPKQSPLTEGGSGSSASPLQSLTRAQVLDRMNVTPELLLIALISCSNNLSSHVLDVFGKQSKYRFFNTALWGFAFFSAMVWGLQSGPPMSSETGVLKFPTVCSVGFLPHLLILAGIIVCLAIYVLALAITAFSLPFEEDGQPVSLRERFALAQDNMQGSHQIHSLRINRHEDFYTTLLRIGYVALTAASEAVFLNEGKAVIARKRTWLEEDRLNEIEASRQKTSSYGNWPNHTSGPPFEAAGFAGFEVPEEPSAWESGYGKEKKIEKPKNGARSMRSQAELGGVGAVRGAARCLHGFSFFRAIFMLLIRWWLYGLSRALDGLGISARPQWLKRLCGYRPARRAGHGIRSSESLDFWILTDEGELELPEDHEFDVELEMRKREHSGRQEWEVSDERRLDEKLYDWFKAGGSWGNQDRTPDYKPSVDEDDTTSVVSTSTNASESDWEDYASDGRRTPTQSNPYPPNFSRESTPLQDPVMEMSNFARLLDPRDAESREEARILAAHLGASGGDACIMTRSRYQKQVERERSRILLTSRLEPSSTTNSGAANRKPSADEEAEMLEQLILSHRAERANPPTADAQTWQSGATGLANGPPCVVCQTNPRSIITWPCRCLCICEDCRVSLAMNNFGSCVTCRQEVGGFMRLWVP